jgi:hypothetical protein
VAAGCPVTRRLGTNGTIGIAAGADPICRCQNHVDPLPLTLVGPGTSSAVVKADLSLPRYPSVLRFVVVNAGGRWSVDDSYCADPSTSIYATTPVEICTTG